MADRLANPSGKKKKWDLQKCSPPYFWDEGSASEGILEWAVGELHRLMTVSYACLPPKRESEVICTVAVTVSRCCFGILAYLLHCVNFFFCFTAQPVRKSSNTSCNHSQCKTLCQNQSRSGIQWIKCQAVSVILDKNKRQVEIKITNIMALFIYLFFKCDQKFHVACIKWTVLLNS